MLCYLHDVERLDVVEALVEVTLHRFRILRLTENLEQVVVAEEVEAREDLALRLQIHVERLLDLLKLRIHLVQLIQSSYNRKQLRSCQLQIEIKGFLAKLTTTAMMGSVVVASTKTLMKEGCAISSILRGYFAKMLCTTYITCQ